MVIYVHWKITIIIINYWFDNVYKPSVNIILVLININSIDITEQNKLIYVEFCFCMPIHFNIS